MFAPTVAIVISFVSAVDGAPEPGRISEASIPFLERLSAKGATILVGREGELGKWQRGYQIDEVTTILCGQQLISERVFKFVLREPVGVT